MDRRQVIVCLVEGCDRPGPFNDQQALRDHLRSAHNIGPKSECTVCGNLYQRASTAYAHVRKVHGFESPFEFVQDSFPDEAPREIPIEREDAPGNHREQEEFEGEIDIDDELENEENFIEMDDGNELDEPNELEVD